jgi:hypothetical protein
MKRLLVLVAVAFGGVAIYAMTAPAGEKAVTPGQITAINKKISALQKSVKKLNGEVGLVESCLSKAVALTEYGSTDNTTGFQYKQANGTVISTTAIATTDTGDTPDWYVLTTTAQCAQAIGIGRPLPRPLNR